MPKRAASLAVPPLTLDRRRALVPQVTAALRIAIRTGRLRRGARVPSSRSLAASIGVSRQIVVAAYEDLCATGELRGRVGAGSYVTAHAVTGPSPQIRCMTDPDGHVLRMLRITLPSAV